MHEQKDELKTAERASELLAQELPERTAVQWRSWLRNNRNAGKQAIYRIPTQKIGREVFYSLEELAEFTRFHKQLRIGDIRPTGRVAEALAAFGVGAGGSGTGHTWEAPGVYAALDEETQAPFVQLHLTSPRRIVYRLTPDQAEEFAREIFGASREARLDSDRIAAAKKS